MAIEIAGIERRFAATHVLRGIDLTIRDGELAALLGPSGSGKTTLLRILAGLDWPDAGALHVDGANWLALEAQRRGVGFVFQNYALFPHMRVADNIAFGLTIRPRATRPSKAEIARRVGELLAMMQIPDLGGRFPAQLSGGQRQRVALARALAIEPKVLLLDEPFGALDAAIRKDLRSWLRQIHDQLGTTTVFVTHDQEEAFELADRVVIMAEGRIEQVGSAEEIHARPASPFVARFLGDANELPVTVQSGRIRAPGLDITRLGRFAIGDGEADLFVRPWEITLEADASAPARIVSVAAAGPNFRYSLSVPGFAGRVAAEIPRRDVAGQGLDEGTGVRVVVHAARLFSSPERNASSPAVADIAAGGLSAQRRHSI
ncbi:MAG: sulfate/molybdate ABC transporter ATP-binding protein [Salinarimonas sp.]